MEYCKIIRDLREDADLTQTQVAEVLGTSQTMYARYERGANEMPIRHLIALCDLYKVSADYILDAEIETEGGYDGIQTFGCEGLLEDGIVKLQGEVAPYAFTGILLTKNT